MHERKLVFEENASRGKYLGSQTHRDPLVLSAVISGKRRALLSLNFLTGKMSIVIVPHWEGRMTWGSQPTPLRTALTL